MDRRLPVCAQYCVGKRGSKVAHRGQGVLPPQTGRAGRFCPVDPRASLWEMTTVSQSDSCRYGAFAKGQMLLWALDTHTLIQSSPQDYEGDTVVYPPRCTALEPRAWEGITTCFTAQS